MHKTTVLLAIQLRMLSEIVRRIVERRPDMKVMSEVSDPIELGFAIKVTRAQVVIMKLADWEGEPGRRRNLLAEYLPLKIMAPPA